MNEWFETHPFLKQMRRRLSVELAVCLLLFCGVFLAARYAGLASAGADAVLGKKKPVVFLDAGHGDFDPGKVSVDGSLEKDINLAIAKRLKWYLEQSDVEDVSGAQVFYYRKSEKGKRLAEILQKRFDYALGDQNRRKAKPNDSYYLLLHVKCPIVIVECGFLSNWKEAALLKTEEYQDRVAYTLHMGIMEYLNGR